VIVTPVGMLIVVKLNAPLSGTWIVWLVVGENAPSAPVEPLLKVFSWPRTGSGNQAMQTIEPSATTRTIFKVSFASMLFVLLFG
jgi:hypothetical protein